MSDLSARDTLRGKRFVVFGGTGFLGKVWLAMVLRFYPDVEHIHLVVRQRHDSDGNVILDSVTRFWDQVATSPVFDPLREVHGADFEDFLKRRITPIPGDVEHDFAGIPQSVRDGIRGTIDALVNSAGLVDFNPPLDYALKANAFGMKNLVALARDLGDVPFLHTSTCYVAGGRTGEVAEVDPREFPFPRADELDRSLWSAEREIDECVDLVDHVRHRTNDAFRQADFLQTAKDNLTARGEPTRGSALTREVDRVRKAYEKKRLSEVGMERATFWGWHNTYTYTKSIGEQVLADSGLRFTLVRPAVIESAVAFPRMGWNEGINTSGPVIYLGLKAPGRFPASDTSTLDVIPVDHVAAGMVAALAELLDDSHKAVYQLGSSDLNPLHMKRFIEIVGLYKRKKLRQTGASPMDRVLALLEPGPMTADTYIKRGPKQLGQWAGQASGLLGRLRKTPLAPVIAPAVKGLDTASKSLSLKAYILDQFLPFMATHTYRFSTANVRSALARLPQKEQDELAYAPEDIDWRHYLQVVHVPGLEENCFPLIEAKMVREAKPLANYDNLVDLLDEVAERFDRMPALMRTEEAGLSRISFADMRSQAFAVAQRLTDAGVQPGDRVLLSGRNRPEWPIAWFGIVSAGAAVVPVDPELQSDALAHIVAKSGARVAVFDDVATAIIDDATHAELNVLDLVRTAAPGVQATPIRPEPDALAAVLFTSGTTGDPKGVMLMHSNFTAMLGSIGALFPLKPTDRILSVLPLHHTFEFSCGLLLPLSRGSRILYLDRLDADRLSYGLNAGRITAMVGVPALWQLLERRIRAQAKERGRLVALGFDSALSVNRALGKNLGIDVGRLAFASVHNRLGGNIRLLISGGAALPQDTHALFQGLGLHLAEGYGLTEAAPVLAVAKARPGAKPGSVGKAIPGVRLRIDNPDDNGVGEVLASGKNVMAGYFANDDATKAVIDEDGWLRTGDLGRLDHKGRLVLMGRAKDVVVTASGENLYLDDIEDRLGLPDGIEELALVGVDDPRGGERLALLAVPTETDATAHASAVAALQAAIAALPSAQRPAVVHVVDAPLPRTATRKVQRPKVREVVQTLIEAAGEPSDRVADGVVPRAVAAIAGVSEASLSARTSLTGDLGFDSLMWVELAAALTAATDRKHDAESLMAHDTLADVMRAVAEPVTLIEHDEHHELEPLNIPQPLREPIKRALAGAQAQLYRNALNTRITGRAFIPTNRNVIVVSNHTSHLDMGLVKYALGAYGERLVGLAAQDYFFQGNRLWVAYFEQLTNLAPLDRQSGFRASLDQARRIVDSGHVVLLFPEGTRRTDGSLGDFKPLVGKLALEAEVDILPLWLEGTYDVLPKGAFLPRGRNIEVRIGPPLPMRELKDALTDARPAEAARTVTQLAQRAVQALRDGTVFDPATSDLLAPPEPAPRNIEEAFHSLTERLEAERVQRPLSWYFSLGGSDGPRFTVTVDEEGCRVRDGRPVGGSADCVVKTSAEVMRKIIDERWLPGPPEFISGTIKTNEIPLVIEFARVFDLSDNLSF